MLSLYLSLLSVMYKPLSYTYMSCTCLYIRVCVCVCVYVYVYVRVCMYIYIYILQHYLLYRGLTDNRVSTVISSVKQVKCSKSSQLIYAACFSFQKVGSSHLNRQIFVLYYVRKPLKCGPRPQYTLPANLCTEF
jgi:hypothetical protein